MQRQRRRRRNSSWWTGRPTGKRNGNRGYRNRGDGEETAPGGQGDPQVREMIILDVEIEEVEKRRLLE